MSAYDPFHPQVGTKVVIPYFVYAVTHPEGVVLFDTGGHPDLIADPHARLGAAAEVVEIEMGPDDTAVAQLGRIGIEAADVRHVVLSHLHYDHAGGIEFFPEATFHLQAREMELAQEPPVYQRDLYVAADFAHPVEWNLLDGDLDLFGDGRLLLFPTPGHSRGHQSLLVRLEREAVVLVGDAALERRNLDQNALPAIVASPDEMVASWRRLEQIAGEERATLLFTHDLAWNETKLGPDEFYA